MQRIQKRHLFLICVISILSACKDDKEAQAPASKPLSMAQYLHDLDAAKAMAKLAQTDLKKYQVDEGALNASAALAKAMSPSMLECWPKKPASTATTDHACLDKKGFVR